MKKLIFIMTIALVSIIETYAQKTTVKFHDTQARALETTTVSHVKPLVVDVEIDTLIGIKGRIVKEILLSKEDAEESMKGDISNIRSWATFQTAKDYNADVIVAPMYEIVTDDTDNGYIVRVMGYIGRFRGWRSMKDEDHEWVRLEKTLKTSDRDKIEAIVKH